MTNYGITIEIDSTGVTQINKSNQLVTFVKQVNSGAAAPLPVAWLTFSPLQNNIVTWQENYYIYASSTTVQSGATIYESSTTQNAVQAQSLYTLSNGAFDNGVPNSSIQPGYFGALNSNDGTLQFGLAQEAMVNNVMQTAPLNIVTVLNNETAQFEPIETISVFLSSYSDNGTVISYVTSNAAVVTLVGASPNATLKFNDSTNTFFQI